MIRIRAAKRGDTKAIGRIQVETWRDAYAGLLPDKVLLRMSAEIEGVSALVRVESSQQQETARDVLAEAMPNNVVALTLSPRTPGWLQALGLEPMLLGLDLRGGVHFLYEVDLDQASHHDAARGHGLSSTFAYRDRPGG